MYVYADCIGVENFPRCVRRVIFCQYILPSIKGCCNSLQFSFSSFDLQLQTAFHIAPTQPAFLPPPPN